MEFQIVRAADPRFPYFWRMVDDHGQMLTYSSTRFRSRDACIDAVRVIQDGAPGARISDLTEGEPGPP